MMLLFLMRREKSYNDHLDNASMSNFQIEYYFYINLLVTILYYGQSLENTASNGKDSALSFLSSECGYSHCNK